MSNLNPKSNHPSITSIEAGNVANHYIVTIQADDTAHAFTIHVHADEDIPYTNSIDNRLFMMLIEFEYGQEMYTNVLKTVSEIHLQNKVFHFPVPLL